MDKEKQRSEVKFGLTSPETSKTKQLAEILKVFFFLIYISLKDCCER
jgi:hypothetical protein